MTHLPLAKPEDLAMDPARLQRAYDLLAQWTSGPEPALPGAALLVGRRGRTLAPRFFGRQGPEPDAEPLREDAAFLLASITKPVAYLAAMLLVERGQLSLTDRVTRFIPDFAAHHKDQTLVLHLFTHTSGLPDMLPNNVDLRKEHAPLERFVEGVVDTVPLFAPGTSVSYQSMGTLMVAEILQRITGQRLPDFIEQEIFRPLGLKSSALGLRHLDAARLARVQIPDYLAGGDYHWNTPYWRQLGVPWGGMFSTPADMAVICQLMLSGGQVGDVRLLSSHAVERMTTNRLHDLPDVPESLRRTQPWGLGWRLNHAGMSDTFSDVSSSRTFGHWGATGTMAWMDPESEVFCLLFTTGQLTENQWRFTRISNIVAAAAG